MSTILPQERLLKLKTDLEADLASLEQQESQIKELLIEVNKLLSNVDNGDKSSLSVASNSQNKPSIDASVQQRNGVSTANGLPKGLTRKHAIWQIISELGGRTFTPRDIRERYLEKYPQSNSKSLSPTVSSLLREMYEKSELDRVERGDKPTDPWVYRVKDGNEEALLKPKL